MKESEEPRASSLDSRLVSISNGLKSTPKS